MINDQPYWSVLMSYFIASGYSLLGTGGQDPVLIKLGSACRWKFFLLSGKPTVMEKETSAT